MRVAAILACIGVMLLAACGGGGKQLTATEYRAKLAAISKEENAAQSAVGQGLKATSVGALAARLKTFADAQDGIGDEVAKLKPPDDAKQANKELAAGLHAIAAATREAIPKVKSAKGPAAAVAALEHSETAAAAGQEVDHAVNVLKKLGYTKGS